MHEVTHVYANMYEFFDLMIQMVNMLILVVICINVFKIKNAKEKKN